MQCNAKQLVTSEAPAVQLIRSTLIGIATATAQTLARFERSLGMLPTPFKLQRSSLAGKAMHQHHHLPCNAAAQYASD
jgi:hypothetical protein